MTPMEAAVAEMWAQLLGAPPASVDDDFFALGAQSLTVVQFLARVQQSYGVELPIDALFSARFTVAEAARVIDEALVDDVRFAELLDELNDLSDDDLKALLDEPAS
jgi:acyl carrier protein